LFSEEWIALHLQDVRDANFPVGAKPTKKISTISFSRQVLLNFKFPSRSKKANHEAEFPYYQFASKYPGWFFVDIFGENGLINPLFDRVQSFDRSTTIMRFSISICQEIRVNVIGRSPAFLNRPIDQQFPQPPLQIVLSLLESLVIDLMGASLMVEFRNFIIE
jgi:hypothetical protein